MDNPTKVLKKPTQQPMAAVDPNKTKIEGQKAQGPGTQPADLVPKKPKSNHSQHDTGLATPEGRAARMKEINADAAKNMRPQITQGSDELKAGVAALKPPSIMDRLKNFSSKAMGGINKIKSNMKNASAMKQINTSIAQKNKSTPMKMDNMPSVGGGTAATKVAMKPQSAQANTNAGVQASMPKTQNAAPMPGVNAKPQLTKSEILDLLKGQFSKLGKPGATEAARAGAAAWTQSQGKAPPHASMTQASQPMAAPAPAKVQAPHVAHAHEHVKSKAHHNKISENIAKVKAPVVPPTPLAHPQPQDHAVKSPENVAHFKQQPTGLPSTTPRKVIPKAEAEKKQFESEKTAPHQQDKQVGDGWGGKSKDENTLEVTPKQSLETEKTVKTKYADVSDPANFSDEKTEGHVSQGKFTDENPKAAAVPNRSESTPATAVHRRGSAQPQSSGADQSSEKPQTSITKPFGKPSPTGPSQPALANAQEKQAPVVAPVQSAKTGQTLSTRSLDDRHFGVKKQAMHPQQQAHSHLLQFLHQLVNPGQHTADEHASRNFMHKAEEVTAKDTIGQTAVKIKEGAKKESPQKQAELLSDPENHPKHNRKKILQMVKACGKMK